MTNMGYTKISKSSSKTHCLLTANMPSCVNTVDVTSHSTGDTNSLIDSKRSNLFFDDDTLKTFASNELQYFEEAMKQVIALHEKLQSASKNLVKDNTYQLPGTEVSFYFMLAEISKLMMDKRKQKKEQED